MKVLQITDTIDKKTAVVGVFLEGKDKDHIKLCERVVRKTIIALANVDRLSQEAIDSVVIDVVEEDMEL